MPWGEFASKDLCSLLWKSRSRTSTLQAVKTRALEIPERKIANEIDKWIDRYIYRERVKNKNNVIRWFKYFSGGRVDCNVGEYRGNRGGWW